MNPVGERTPPRPTSDFGERQAGGSSAVFRDWALAVAADPEVLALVDTLPEREAAAEPGARRRPVARRSRPARTTGCGACCSSDWEAVRATVLARATQTNEVGRCATLLPVLAALPGPLALLEVGASAGLCLYPDRYSYRYSDGDLALDPADGPSPVVLECAVDGTRRCPTRCRRWCGAAGST